MTHLYESASAAGFGRWQQCRTCGATIHHGHYWYAGHKSKEEPPCSMLVGSLEYEQWFAAAQRAPHPE